MDELTTFESEQFGEIRTVEIDKEIWFVGKDVASALGYTNPQKAIKDHVNEEDRKVNDSFTLGSGSSPVIINESGLYSLIFGSKLDSAKEFKHWVTSEVLPSLRKSGTYTVKSATAEKELEIAKQNAGIASAKILLELSDKYQDNPEYSQILDAHATKQLTGEFIIPLPQTEKTYSATEIGQMLGISANKVGSIAKKLDLKTDKYGKWFLDKAPNGKEVQSFRYFDSVVSVIKDALTA